MRRRARNVCPKNPAWVYLQDAKVGDVFTIDAEFVVLVAKNGNQWTLQRGYGLSAPSDHSSTTLWAHCMARDFFHGVSNWSWTWDTAKDPHGINSDGTTVRVAWDYDHPVPRTEVTLGGMPSYDRQLPVRRMLCSAGRRRFHGRSAEPVRVAGAVILGNVGHGVITSSVRRIIQAGCRTMQRVQRGSGSRMEGHWRL